MTNDIVCYAFCENNPLTHYRAALGWQVPHPDQACEYYNKLFSSAHPDNKIMIYSGDSMDIFLSPLRKSVYSIRG